MSFQDFYFNKIRPKTMKELKIVNPMAVPRIIKIVVNVGVGEAISNKKALGNISSQLMIITGQKPVYTLARKSIATFKIRKGIPIGVKVTLRGKRMYIFLEKLIKVVIPRIRDFKGISEKSIDLKGNLNIGFSEQTIFPEIEFDGIDRIRGLEVTIVTNAKNKKTGKILFKNLGIPFKGNSEN